jgi:hypothetical protein
MAEAVEAVVIVRVLEELAVVVPEVPVAEQQER